MLRFVPFTAATGFLAIGAFTIGACTMTDIDRASTGDTRNLEQTDVAAMAATYRHLFANNASGLKSSASTYCVAVGARSDLADPSPALLAALSELSPKVQQASACRISDRVVNTAGQPSLLFTLRSLGCESADSCLFEGGYYEGNLSASAGQYRARKVDGRWQVTPEGPQGIS